MIGFSLFVECFVEIKQGITEVGPNGEFDCVELVVRFAFADLDQSFGFGFVFAIKLRKFHHRGLECSFDDEAFLVGNPEVYGGAEPGVVAFRLAPQPIRLGNFAASQAEPIELVYLLLHVGVGPVEGDGVFAGGAGQDQVAVLDRDLEDRYPQPVPAE